LNLKWRYCYYNGRRNVEVESERVTALNKKFGDYDGFCAEVAKKTVESKKS
jgi:hypothetical protein